MHRIRLILWAALLLSASLQAQVVTVGEGTENTYVVPFGNYFQYSWCETHYNSAEIGQTGTINAIAWHVGQAAQVTYQQLNIYMGMSNDVFIPSPYSWTPLSGLELVYSGQNITLGADTGWMEFALDQPFAYTDMDQCLVVVISHSASSSQYSNQLQWTYTASPESCLYRQTDGSPAYAQHPGSAGGQLTQLRANIRLSFGSSHVCMPPSGLTLQAVGTDTARVAWQRPAGSTGTDVAIGELGFNPDNAFADFTTDSVYTFTNLLPNQLYQVALRNYCPLEQSSWTTLTFRTNCVPLESNELPYQEDFDQVAVNGYPPCWQRLCTVDGFPKVQDFVGSNRLTLTSGQSAYCYALLPELDSDIDISDLQLSFQLRCSNVGYTRSLEVGVMSDPSNPNTFQPLHTLTASQITDQFAEFELPLSSYAGTARYLAFHAQTQNTYSYLYLDNIALDYIPSCLRPASAQVVSTTAYTATLAWTPADTSDLPDSYTVLYGTSPDPDENPDFDVFYSTQGTLTGLSPVTTYYAWIYSNCGNGSSDLRYIGSFTTGCAPITLLPWSMDFDSLPGTSGNLDLPPCWLRLSATQGSYNPNPCPYRDASTAHSGNTSLSMYMSYYTTMYGMGNLIALPEFENLSQLQLSLWAYQESANPCDLFVVGVWEENYGFVPIDTLSLTNTYEQYSVNFLAYEGTGTRPALRAYRAYGAMHVYVDDIVIDMLPDCLDPSNLHATSATDSSLSLAWSGDPGLLYQLAYDTLPQASPLPHDTLYATSCTLNHLLPGTTYYIYVRAICGTDFSPWISCQTQTEEAPEVIVCDTLTTLSWSEDFERWAEGELPHCWEALATSANGSMPAVTHSPGYAHSGSRYLGFYSTSSAYNLLMLPSFANLSQLQLCFWARHNGEPQEFSVGLVDDSLHYTALQTLALSSQYEYFTIDLSAYTSGRLAFYCAGPMGTAFVDDMVLQLPPTCMAPQALTASAVTSSSASIAWFDTLASGWTLLYDSLPFSPSSPLPSTRSLTLSSPTATLTGLSAATTYSLFVQALCSDTTLWSPQLSFTTPCDDIVSVPWSEDFEGMSQFSPCWQVLEGSVNGFPKPFGANPHSGQTAVSMRNYAGGNLLVLPAFASLEGLQFSFWACQEQQNAPDLFTVGVYTDAAQYLPIDTLTLTSQYALYLIDLAPYAPLGHRLALQASRIGGEMRLYLDDFSIDSLSSCLPASTPVASGITTSSASLRWSQQGESSVTGYLVEYGPLGFTLGQGQHLFSTVPSAYLYGLSSSTVYECYVRTLCASGDSAAWSAPCRFTTLCDALVVFPYEEDFNLTPLGELPPCWEAWSNGRSAQYHPQVRQGGNFWGTADSTANLTLTAGTSGYLDQGTQSFVRLPQLAGQVSDLSLSFWMGTEDNQHGTLAIGYFTSNDLSTSFVPLHTIQASSLTQAFGISTDAGLRDTVDFSSAPAGALYIGFRWSGVNSSYYNVYLDDISVTTSSAVCPMPSQFIATTLGAETLQLTWGGASQDYELSYRAMNQPTFCEPLPLSGHSHTLAGLQPGMRYQLRLRQVCSEGFFSPWAETEGETDSLHCPAPTGLTTVWVSGTSAELSWQSGGDEEEWQLRYATQGDTLYLSLHGESIAQLRGLLSPAYYTAWVRARCAENCFSPWSEPLHFSTSPCPAVEGIEVSQITAHTARVSWQSEANRWRLNLGPANHQIDEADAILLVEGSSETLLEGLQAGTTYDIILQSLCADGGVSEGVRSQPFTTNEENDVDTPSADMGWTLYPNPAQERVSIAGYEGEVIVVDLQGRKVMVTHISQTDNTLDVSTLPTGAYFVKCGSAVGKLLVR